MEYTHQRGRSKNFQDDVDIHMESVDIVPKGEHEFNINYGLREHSDPKYWSQYFSDAKLNDFKSAAYGDPTGLSTRFNPVNGKHELFIAGTRTGREWVQNLIEGAAHSASGVVAIAEKAVSGIGIIPELKDISMEAEQSLMLVNEGIEFTNYSEQARDAFSDRIDALIEEQGIDVVYGHSRGAAILSGLHSDVVKIGIDGASYIGHHGDYLNIVESPDWKHGFFDNIISAGHKENLKLKQRKFHNVLEARGADSVQNLKKPGTLKILDKPTAKFTESGSNKKQAIGKVQPVYRKKESNKIKNEKPPVYKKFLDVKKKTGKLSESKSVKNRVRRSGKYKHVEFKKRKDHMITLLEELLHNMQIRK